MRHLVSHRGLLKKPAFKNSGNRLHTWVHPMPIQKSMTTRLLFSIKAAFLRCEWLITTSNGFSPSKVETALVTTSQGDLPSLFFVLSNGLPLFPMHICITCVLQAKLTTQMFAIKIRRSRDRVSNECYLNINNGNLTTECAVCMSPWEPKMGQRTIISPTVPWVSMDLLGWEPLGAGFVCTTLSAVAYPSYSYPITVRGNWLG